MIANESDPFVLRAVVRALAKIGSAEAAAAVTLAGSHRFKIVRELARELAPQRPEGGA
jgi:hypothetical protein